MENYIKAETTDTETSFKYRNMRTIKAGTTDTETSFKYRNRKITRTNTKW